VRQKVPVNTNAAGVAKPGIRRYRYFRARAGGVGSEQL
jgi:hypothetical protein